MSWYMRSAEDRPHQAHEYLPGQSVCGLPLVGAKEVTEAQIVVHLGNKRCPSCLGIGRPGRAGA